MENIKEVFRVEFLFSYGEDAEVIELGIFDSEALAHTYAFDFAEKYIDDKNLTALYITKFELNKINEQELVEEYYF